MVTGFFNLLKEICNVRFEERAREFIYVARLIKEAEAKASINVR